MKSFHTYKIAAEHAGQTVEEYLKQVLQHSGRTIQKLTRQQGVFLNGRKTYLQKKLKSDDTLRIPALQDRSYGVEPEQGGIEILFEDNYVMVLNKPAFQLVHPAGRTASGTLSNYLAYHWQQQGVVNAIRPIHRLDRDTSGCILFAKDAHSQFLLEQQLSSRLLKRTYQALVQGKVEPASGTIDAPIAPHPRMPNRRAVSANGEPALTHYRTLRSFQNYTLLELVLDTGRTHQIRIHAAHIGHPVIGDGMYGIRVPWMLRQALHAASVSFLDLQHGREVTVDAPLPPDFHQAIKHVTENDVSCPND